MRPEFNFQSAHKLKDMYIVLAWGMEMGRWLDLTDQLA